MSENLLTILALLVLYLGIPVALLLLLDRLRRPSRAKMEEASRRFLERLQHPDLAAVARHFGRPLPASLQALYANPGELLRQNFIVAAPDAPAGESWTVAYYQPADGENVQDRQPGTERFFAFADDGCGNAYLVDPALEDPPVLFHDHETGDIQKVCDRFTEFMRWPRRAESE
jgi:hypothetical protein